MHKPQAQVRAFHFEIVGGPTSPAQPAIRDAELRARLVVEEAAETALALVGAFKAYKVLMEFSCWARNQQGVRDEPDLVEVVDGLCDLVYVAYGTAEAVGVDLEPFFNAVHASNMAKTGEVVDDAVGAASGKRGRKPPGWVPPTDEIRRLLESMQEEPARPTRVAWRPSSHPGEIRRRALEDALEVVRGERLQDPVAGTDDEAYQRALGDAARAVQVLLDEEERTEPGVGSRTDSDELRASWDELLNGGPSGARR